MTQRTTNTSAFRFKGARELYNASKTSRASMLAQTNFSKKSSKPQKPKGRSSLTSTPEAPPQPPKEVDVSKNPTKLLRLIMYKQYQAAIARLDYHPHEASTWVCLNDGKNKNSSGNGYTARHLPIHIACLLVKPQSPAVEPLLKRLMEVYPDGVKFKDNGGKLPIHIACWKGASADIISLMLKIYPASIHVKDNSKKSPLEYNRGCNNPDVRAILFKFKNGQVEIENFEKVEEVDDSRCILSPPTGRKILRSASSSSSGHAKPDFIKHNSSISLKPKTNGNDELKVPTSGVLRGVDYDQAIRNRASVMRAIDAFRKARMISGSVGLDTSKLAIADQTQRNGEMETTIKELRHKLLVSNVENTILKKKQEKLMYDAVNHHRELMSTKQTMKALKRQVKLSTSHTQPLDTDSIGSRSDITEASGMTRNTSSTQCKHESENKEVRADYDVEPKVKTDRFDEPEAEAEYCDGLKAEENLENQTSETVIETGMNQEYSQSTHSQNLNPPYDEDYHYEISEEDKDETIATLEIQNFALQRVVGSLSLLMKRIEEGDNPTQKKWRHGIQQNRYNSGVVDELRKLLKGDLQLDGPIQNFVTSAINDEKMSSEEYWNS